MPDSVEPTHLAADGDDVPAGEAPPSEDEQLEYLAARGWPA